MMACAAFALALLLGVASEARAHATLIASEPADGSVIATQPAMLQLHFNEPVTPSSVKLIDASGNERADAVVHARDSTVTVTLPPSLPSGTHLVSYRVISADGHPVAGSTMFSLGHVTGSAKAASGSVWRGAATVIARVVLYLGLFGGVGSVVFAHWIARTPVSAPPLLALGLAGAVASLALQGLELLDLPLSALLTPGPWEEAAGTSLGPSLLIAVVAIIMAALSLTMKVGGALSRALSALALIGVGASLAASGHASSAPPQGLMRSMVFLHGIAVTYWAGALLPLLALLRKPDFPVAGDLVAGLDRFARGALVAVPVLLVSGVTLAIVQVEHVAALAETAYGEMLAVKLALVAALLALAVFNRFYLTSRLRRATLTRETRAGSALARSIVAEGAIVLAILGIVAGWRLTPPPRALAAVANAPLSLHLHTLEGMVQVTITPGRVGPNDILLQFLSEDFSTRAVLDAGVALSLPEKGIEGVGAQSAQELPDGMREARRVMLPQPGRWKLKIDALITDFQQFSVEGEFEMPPR